MNPRRILAPMVALALMAAATQAQATDEPAPPRCDPGQPHPNAHEAFSEYAFLIGDYAISAHAWLGQDWSPPRPGPSARWNGAYGLDGLSIVDEWFDVDPGVDPDTHRGVNIRMVNPESGEWEMMWIASRGFQVQHLRADMIDGRLTMWQVYPERAAFRAVFEVIDDAHWQRIEYARDEAGEWQPKFLLRASRIPCDA